MLMHVTLHLKYGQLPALFQTMPKVKAIVETVGWELQDAMYFMNGRLNTAVHIWKLRDLNHYAQGMQALMGHPQFPALSAELAALCDEEFVAFADNMPYSPRVAAAG
jgi:hypothetical protein